MKFKFKNIPKNIRRIKGKMEKSSAERRTKERDRLSQQIAIEKEKVALARQRSKLAKLRQGSGGFGGGMMDVMGNISGMKESKKKKDNLFGF